jgi:ATP-dependent helicase/nuclease subunit A
MARGTGNRRDPVRVAVTRHDVGTNNREATEDQPAISVSVGDFLSEADEDAAAREREETKRLLYVALTRARDRLYLGSVLKEGRLQPGRGSLAEVLPATLCEAFAATGGSADRQVTWRASSGSEHVFAAVEDLPLEGGSYEGPVASGFSRNGALSLDAKPKPQPETRDDFDPLLDTSTRRTRVTGFGSIASVPEPAGGGDSDRLVGTLVHRLIERHGLASAPSAEDVERWLPSLLDADELVDVTDLRTLASRAAAGYAAVCSRDDVQALCADGERLHEVRFAMATQEGIVRGTIDCLVRRRDGAITILEFKTGRARPEHRAQLDLYVRAAAQLFPGARVEAILVYPDTRPDAPGVLTK